MARLDGIQRAQDYPYSNFLCDLEFELQERLEKLLKLEEIKWFQKSCSIWITKGDRNTGFYHLKTKLCKRRNKVVMHKNDQGV